jgi:hypothetical protein
VFNFEERVRGEFSLARRAIDAAAADVSRLSAARRPVLKIFN